MARARAITSSSWGVLMGSILPASHGQRKDQSFHVKPASEQRALAGHARPAGEAIWAKGILPQPGVRRIDLNYCFIDETEAAQRRVGPPLGISSRGLRHQQHPADSQQGGSALGGHRRCPESSRCNYIERAPEAGIAAGVFG